MSHQLLLRTGAARSWGLPGLSGSGAYVPGSSAAQPASMNGAESAKSLRNMPATSYIIFRNVPKLEAIKSKLREFNSLLSASPENRSMMLGEADVAPGSRLDMLLARYVLSTPFSKMSLSRCRGLRSLSARSPAAVSVNQEGHSVHLYCLPAC